MDDSHGVVSILQDMFPAIDVITELKKNTNWQNKTRNSNNEDLQELIEHFLTLQDNQSNTTTGHEKDGKDAEVVEMVTLEPASLWLSGGDQQEQQQTPTSTQQDDSFVIEQAKKKRKQEEEDELLAMKLYEQELQHQRQSVPSHSQPSATNMKETLAEAHALRMIRKTGSQPQQQRKRPQQQPQQQRQQQQQQQQPTSRNSALADVHEKRILQQQHTSNNRVGTNGGVSETATSSYPPARQQLKEIRDKHRSNWRNTALGRKRIWTMSDIEEKEKNDRQQQANWEAGTPTTGRGGIHTIDNTIMDPTRIGKEALTYTNAFRQKNGLPALKWHQALCQIGVKHSKDMGDGDVPFGHAGFNNRVKQYPFSIRGAAENVAMSHGMSDVAKVAVDGWIDSPGHRKNLLSHMEWCAIGVYRNAKGAWYLTQLFGI